MQLGRFTEIETTIFSISEANTRPYEYKDRVHLSISYEFNLNLHRVDREVYNLLDWLGDVGGLRDALFMIGTFVLLIHVFVRGN